MANSGSDGREEYFTYIQKQQQRVEQGLPPLGQEGSVKKLTNSFSSDPKLKFQEEGHVQEEHKVGDIHFRSSAPGFPYHVIFIDDGEVAYFYASANYGDEEDSILDALQIYNTQELTDQDKVHLFEIIWSINGLQAALLINKYVHAVFDFESFHGCCRTNFPPVNPDSSFGEFSHNWTEECMKWFY